MREWADWPLEYDNGEPLRRIAVIDTETTGLDWARHTVIEICAASVLADHAGRVVTIDRMSTGLQDSGHSL